MSIRRMSYVACDACGCPIGGPDDMGDNARAARRAAARLGAVRDGKSDLCGHYYNGCGAGK
jgi:hypothetical protein